MRTVAIPSALVVLAFACVNAPAGTRLSAYGSNPYLSWQLFPQDVSKWHGSFLAYEIGYDKSPYWGDIDDPRNKPDGSYTSTGLERVYPSGASFDHSANIYSIDNAVSYNHRFPSGTMANLALDFDIDSRTNSAEGTFIDDADSPIPFDYSMRHSLTYMYLQGMFGFELGGVPVGLRLEGGYENTVSLDHSLTFTRYGTTYSTDRATWGWTTSPCAHIFGASGVEGDAWLQGGYATGPLYEIDAQAGVTLNKSKVGARFAYHGGHQDYYRWRPDSTTSMGDSVLDAHFAGSYELADWSRTQRDMLVLLYGNAGLRSSEHYSLNTFVLLGYEGKTLGQALSTNLAVADDAEDKTRSILLEVAPNLMLPFGGSAFSYIDVAIPIEYVYSRFDNTYLYWIGGGQMETHRNSSTNAGDERSWESFSYANRNTLSVGMDLNTMFPLVNKNARRLSFGVQLLLDVRYTFMTKYYGQNVEQGADLDFRVDNQREDYLREVRFATGLKLQYQRRPFLVWFEVGEPLLHSLLPRTSVTDASGDQLLYEHEKSPLWLSEEGLRLGLFLSYDMALPFLKSM